MTEHESQTIFKIVIPYEEYQRLKTIEVQFHNLQKEFVSLQTEKKLREKVPEETDSSEKTITSKINALQGSGEDGTEQSITTVLPPTLLSIDENQPVLPQPDVVYVKSDASNEFEDARLLKTVPKSHFKKAQNLLSVLNERSSELTWNSDGIIFIDQIPLPGSNIFNIFRYLFVRQKPLDSLGFIELHDKIQSMGLSSLINIRHRIKEGKVIKKVTRKDSSFWFLG